MEKYKQAFKYYEAEVKRLIIMGVIETEARAYCRHIADGIIQVAIYDNDITLDQFYEIENLRYGHDE